MRKNLDFFFKKKIDFIFKKNLKRKQKRKKDQILKINQRMRAS